MIEGRVTWFWNGGFTCPKPLFYKEGILGNGLSWTAVGTDGYMHAAFQEEDVPGASILDQTTDILLFLSI